MPGSWTEFLERVQGQRVLVVGELSLTRILHGKLTVDDTDPLFMRLETMCSHDLPGGAAAIARALMAVGARAAACGLIGDDEAGHAVLERLAACGVDTQAVVCAPARGTAALNRITTSVCGEPEHTISEWQQVDETPISPDVQEHLHQAAVAALRSAAELVIVSAPAGPLQFLIDGLCGLAHERGLDVTVPPAHAQSMGPALHSTGGGKLTSLKELQWFVAQQRDRGRRMVFTNGCFDLLHAGHAKYLQAAAELGDYLVVALNDDASVRALKGSGRPVVDERQRATLLGALACVDAIILFSTEDVRPLLDVLQPEVYVKGGDYTLDTINQQERHLIESYGGQIALLPGEDGLSTTDLIRAIRALP
jgi:rfaE bifunctional protein nucleotidyltransferase chain/domain